MTYNVFTVFGVVIVVFDHKVAFLDVVNGTHALYARTHTHVDQFLKS